MATATQTICGTCNGEGTNGLHYSAPGYIECGDCEATGYEIPEETFSRISYLPNCIHCDTPEFSNYHGPEHGRHTYQPPLYIKLTSEQINDRRETR